MRSLGTECGTTMASSKSGGPVQPNDVGKCPHCSEKLRFEDAEFVLGQTGWVTDVKKSSESNLEVRGAKGAVRILAAGCPQCGEPIVSIDTKQKQWPAYPRSPLRPVPKEVRSEDKSVAEDYEEAALLLTLSPKASAALGRRCLQMVLVKKAKVNPKDFLNTQINQVLTLKTDPLPGYVSKNLHAIRHLGNFGAHPMFTSVGEIVDVKPGEAEWTLAILDDLFDHYYVKPKQAEKKRIALNKKLKKVGKPPVA